MRIFENIRIFLKKSFRTHLTLEIQSIIFFNFKDEFIIGRVIKAMNANWHPHCFTCEMCNKQLADVGFLRNAGRFHFNFIFFLHK